MQAIRKLPGRSVPGRPTAEHAHDHLHVITCIKDRLHAEMISQEHASVAGGVKRQAERVSSTIKDRSGNQAHLHLHEVIETAQYIKRNLKLE